MDWVAVAREFGLPLTMLILALVTGRMRVWVWARELDALNAERERERAEWAAERAELKAERTRWERIGWDSVQMTKEGYRMVDRVLGGSERQP